MSVTLYQMKAWNAIQRRIAEKKAQQERMAVVLPVMKKAEPKQLRLV